MRMGRLFFYSLISGWLISTFFFFMFPLNWSGVSNGTHGLHALNLIRTTSAYRGLRSFIGGLWGWGGELHSCPEWWCYLEAQCYCSCPGFSLRSALWKLSAKKWRKWPVTRSGSACARVSVTMSPRCPTWSVTYCSRTPSCSWQRSRRLYSTAAPASSRYVGRDVRRDEM